MILIFQEMNLKRDDYAKLFHSWGKRSHHMIMDIDVLYLT